MFTPTCARRALHRCHTRARVGARTADFDRRLTLCKSLGFGERERDTGHKSLGITLALIRSQPETRRVKEQVRDWVVEEATEEVAKADVEVKEQKRDLSRRRGLKLLVLIEIQ